MTFLRRTGGCLAASTLFLVVSCGDQEIILPGERLDMREDAAVVQPTADRSAPLRLAAASLNRQWPQVGGSALHDPGHPALGRALGRMWSNDIGAGNDRKRRLTADPVTDGARIYTLDSRARVTAFGLGGEALWSRDLTPPADRPDDTSGGGLAVEGGTLFVSTAFGEVHALDAASGTTRWSQDLDAAATGAPAVADGVVHVVSRNATGWAFDSANGRVLWQVLGAPSDRGIAGGPAPALTASLAIYPFSSAQMIAATRVDGRLVWSAIVGGRRLGRAFSRVSDLTGDPVIQGNVVYAGNHAGRSAAFDLATGQQIWSAEGGAMSPVTVAGGSVFLISDENRLLRLDAATGAEIWSNPLPFFTRERPSRRKGTHAHFGPLLAGGRLLVASDDGNLRQFDPQSGRLVGALSLGAPAARNPVVAGGVLYIVTADGRLHAWR